MKKRILSILLAVVLLSTLAWAVDADGPGAEIDPERQFTIRYNSNNGSDLFESVEIPAAQIIGYSLKSTCNFTAPEGTVFKGWSTSENGATITTIDAALAENAAENDGYIDLYTIWGSTSTIVIIVPAEEQIQNPTTGALLTVAALPAAAAAHFGALAH